MDSWMDRWIDRYMHIDRTCWPSRRLNEAPPELSRHSAGNDSSNWFSLARSETGSPLS